MGADVKIGERRCFRITAPAITYQEIVTRNFPEGVGEVDVVAIYEVRDDKIVRAWFKLYEPQLGRWCGAARAGRIA